MSESDEDKPRRKSSASADAPSSAVSRELNEDEIDAPSKQTLIMLGAISLTTLLLWGAGRAACNYQIPGESLTPRPVSLAERTRGAKDVGFEFAQSLSGGRFEDALSIATGEALELVKKERAACGSCLDRKAAQEKIFSTAVVLKSNSVDALVKVRTVGAPGGEVTRFFGVEREGRKWKVSRVAKDAESLSLKPAPSEAGSPDAPSPAPDDAADGEAAKETPTSEDEKKPEGKKLSPSAPGQKDKAPTPKPKVKTPSAPKAPGPSAPAAPKP